MKKEKAETGNSKKTGDKGGQKTLTRERVIVRTSAIGIIMNMLLAAVKVTVGYVTGSIAIMSEGANSVTDVLNSFLTLVGTKLARKHPDEKHPFGYGRIEHLTGLAVSVMILVTGSQMLISSFRLFFEPEELTVSNVSLIIIIVSAITKFILGIYTIKMGRKTESAGLEAVGLECRNDSFGSVITIISIAAYLYAGLYLDAIAGILISGLIIRSGLEVLMHTISELIGRPGEKELAAKIYRDIRSTPGVLAAADMMLHNYGPDAWSGSANLEIDHKKTVGEIYQFLHKLQLRIMHEYGVTMVFGIYAVDNDHEDIKAVRKYIAEFIKGNDNVISSHAVYIDDADNRLYCDFIVDYKLKDWEALREQFIVFFQKKYPGMDVELTIETEFI